jgi:GDP-L-fucose synthase
MKIAVLGSRGFIGRNILSHLSNDHHVFPVTRDDIDLLNYHAVKEFLEGGQFDIIINCAAVMTHNESLHDARNNFTIFMNFFNNSNLFKKFINTASGAEFDRDTDIKNVSESEIFHRAPKDSYGWGQNMKARLCAQTEGFYNIRIFNCFGKGEPFNRIFPKFLRDKQVSITGDRYFDYFSIQDLLSVVEHCVLNDWQIKDINAVYENKFKISEALQLFCEVNNIEQNFTIASESNLNYTGSGVLLKSLGLKLIGLEEGFRKYL